MRKWLLLKHSVSCLASCWNVLSKMPVKMMVTMMSLSAAVLIISNTFTPVFIHHVIIDTVISLWFAAIFAEEDFFFLIYYKYKWSVKHWFGSVIIKLRYLTSLPKKLHYTKPIMIIIIIVIIITILCKWALVRNLSVFMASSEFSVEQVLMMKCVLSQKMPVSAWDSISRSATGSHLLTR